MLLPSEMLAAAEAAEERGVPISLGDTDVGELGPRLKELLIASLMDLLSPGEGWKRIGDDLKRGARLAFDTSDLDGDALEFSDFLKPDLLLGFVTSLLAYPAAALVKALIPVGGLLVGSAFGAHYLEAAAREADALAAAGGDSSASYLLLSDCDRADRARMHPTILPHRLRRRRGCSSPCLKSGTSDRAGVASIVEVDAKIQRERAAKC